LSEGEGLIYLGQPKPRPSSILRGVLRRIVGVLVSPFATFEEIGEAPDLIGPVLLAVLTVLVSIGEKYLLYASAGYIAVPNVNITAPTVNLTGELCIVDFTGQASATPTSKPVSGLTLFEPNISIHAAAASVELLLTTILAYLIASFITYLLKGATKGMLQASFYTLSLRTAQVAAVTAIRMAAISQIPRITVFIPKEPPLVAGALVTQGVAAALGKAASWAVTAASLINWFATLWYLVMWIALIYGVGKTGIGRAVLGGFVTITAVSLISTPLMRMLPL